MLMFGPFCEFWQPFSLIRQLFSQLSAVDVSGLFG